MAIADPKDYAQKKESTEALSMVDLIAALKAATGNDDDSLQRRAQYEAEAHARLNKRENTEHPGKSVYSHPEGDVARPKANLICEMFWAGYDLTIDNLTPVEIDLLNQAQIGEFLFHKTDGSESKLTVAGETNAHGKYQRLLFTFPCRGDHRHNLPSMAAMLREAYGLVSAEQAELIALRAEVAARQMSVAS